MNVRRISLFFVLVLVSMAPLTVFLQSSIAQDYTQMGLPEGAKLRLGKGYIIDLKFSPDGDRLAVASSIGIWIYDVFTGRELNLLTKDARPPKGSTIVKPENMFTL